MIVVFGSLVCDIVMVTPDLPRPGETVLTDAYQMLPGGKGANQALAAARTGAPVQFVGCRGRDTFGATALGNLEAAGVDLSGVSLSDRPTACASVCVDTAGANQIVVASGANLDVRAQQLDEISIAAGDVGLFQMEVPLTENWQAIKSCHDRGGRTILNAAPFAPVPSDVLTCLDVLVVNEVEAAGLAADLDLGDLDEPALARQLADRFGLTAVITLGAGGAVAASAGGQLTVTALDIDARDTVGAGDAFVGSFAAAYADGAGLGDCLRHAAVAGSLTCLQPGAQDGLPDAAAIAARLNDVTVSQT